MVVGGNPLRQKNTKTFFGIVPWGVLLQKNPKGM